MKSKVKEAVKKRKLNKKSRGKITPSNIDEHRKKIIKSGKKFKYPTHISMRWILIAATIVFCLAMVIFTFVSYWRLYKVQTTSDFYYTITRILPLPVAEVDGQSARYSDYLRRLRASTHYIEDHENRDLASEEGASELTHIKRANLDEAEKVAFAYKIAKENNLTVSNDEILADINKALVTESGTEISLRAYEMALNNYYGWSLDDYRHIVKDSLTVRKVSFFVDSAARKKIEEAKQKLDVGEDFAKVAKDFSDDKASKEKGGDVGAIALNNMDKDGLIAAASKLQPGHVSGIIEGSNAFYIVKLIEKNDKTIHYSMIRVGLSEFDKRFKKVKEENKITEYIEVKSDQNE